MYKLLVLFLLLDSTNITFHFNKHSRNKPHRIKREMNRMHCPLEVCLQALNTDNRCSVWSFCPSLVTEITCVTWLPHRRGLWPCWENMLKLVCHSLVTTKPGWWRCHLQAVLCITSKLFLCFASVTLNEAKQSHLDSRRKERRNVKNKLFN